MNRDVSRNHEDETSNVSTGESVEELPFGHGVVNKRFTYHDVTFHADQHEIPGTDEYVSPEHALTVPCVANDEICNTISGQPIPGWQKKVQSSHSAYPHIHQRLVFDN